MTAILFSARPETWAAYETHLRSAFAQLSIDVSIGPDVPDEDVEFIIYAPNGGLSDFGRFPRLKAVQSLWAGVERIVGNQTLTVPLARMVDPGRTQGMVDWCVAHVMRHHVGLDADVMRQDANWVPHVPPLASERCVTVLGMGALGSAVADALALLGFRVHGWSRTPKVRGGLTCHSGPDGLKASLRAAQILVLLLPDTPATENIIDATALDLMPHGAFIINPGRGPLIDDAALLAALDDGRIAHATLDTFRVEPLPQDHRYWTHPSVTVTPHIASETRPSTAARSAAENIARAMRGDTMHHLVDPARGY